MKVFLAFVLVALPLATAEEFSYAAFTRDGESFPGYGVSHRGALCIVTAVNPSDEGNDTLFDFQEGKRFDVAQAKTYQQPSSSVFIIGGADFPHAVAYEPEFVLKAGDRLVAVSPEGKKVEGDLMYNPANGEDYHSTMGPLNLNIFIDDKDAFPGAGAGWPVFSVESGNAVGTVVIRRSVVKPYDPVELPGRFQFEPLCLPTGDKGETEKMTAYGGIPLVKPLPKQAFRWLLPGCLWDVEVGMSRETLEAKRGKLSSLREDFKDHMFIIREDTPVCYRVQYVPGRDKENRDRIVEIQLEGYTNSHLGEFPKAEKLIAGLEQAFGKPRLFTTSLDATGLAGRQFAAHWLCGDRSVTLRMLRGPIEISAYVVISESKTSTLLDMIMKKQKLGTAPASMVEAYKDWLAAFERE
ncbi:MAG: hypothetical protein ACSHX9_09150 [Luteolibacter sp.]